MARQPSKLKVVVTPRAMRDLYGIWEYNASEYGADHAEACVSFLRKEAYKLDRSYFAAKPVTVAVTEFFYINLRRSERK